MTSSIFLPRRSLAVPAPRTHLTASTMFVLPEPFGPTIAVTPPSNRISVGRAKVLKPQQVKRAEEQVRLRVSEGADLGVCPGRHTTCGFYEVRPEGRPRDLEIQVVRAAGKGGPARNALKVRDDDGTGPITSGSGRMGSKDPVGISGRTSLLDWFAKLAASPGRRRRRRGRFRRRLGNGFGAFVRTLARFVGGRQRSGSVPVRRRHRGDAWSAGRTRGARARGPGRLCHDLCARGARQFLQGDPRGLLLGLLLGRAVTGAQRLRAGEDHRRVLAVVADPGAFAVIERRLPESLLRDLLQAAFEVLVLRGRRQRAVPVEVVVVGGVVTRGQEHGSEHGLEHVRKQ